MTEDVEVLLIGDRSKKINQALKLAEKTNTELEQDIEILRTWIKSQPHLPETPSHEFFINLVILNKFSIEKCKNHIDMYYSLRSVLPELFVKKQFNEPHMKVASNAVTYVPLPKLTEEGYRVAVIKFLETSPDDFVVYDTIPYVLNFVEIRMVADVMMGEIVIIDVKYFTFSHVSKITPIQIKKIFMCIEKIYKNIVKQMHFVNVAPYVENLISLIKQFVSKKLADRIHAHQNTDKLQTFFNKDILPKDYGGPDYTIEELKAKWVKLAEKYNQRLIDLENLKIDESKRPTPLVDDELLGFYGNFKKLNVD